MFKGIIDELRNITSLMRTRNSLLEALLAEQCAKRERDGRRNRKGHAEEAKLYADGMADHDSFSTTDGFGKTVQPKPEA